MHGLRAFFIYLVTFVLFGTSAAGRVRDPAGVKAKGKGLEEGFLQTFPDYERKTKKSTADALSGLKLYFKNVPLEETIHSFRSIKPETIGSDGKTYLSFSLREITFKSDAKAALAITELAKYGIKDMGYSLAQDFAVLTGKRVFWLRQSCLFSNKNANLIREKLRYAIGEGTTAQMICGCGTNCDFSPNARKKP